MKAQQYRALTYHTSNSRKCVGVHGSSAVLSSYHTSNSCKCMGVNGEALQLHAVYKKLHFLLQVMREFVSVLQVMQRVSERAMGLYDAIIITKVPSYSVLAGLHYGIIYPISILDIILHLCCHGNRKSILGTHLTYKWSTFTNNSNNNNSTFTNNNNNNSTFTNNNSERKVLICRYVTVRTE